MTNQTSDQTELRPGEPVMVAPAAKPGGGLLAKLGLDRPELRAWAMYDWANSAFMTTIITAVFPIYFAKTANAGEPEGTATFRLSVATTLGLAIIAVASPILGAIADFRPVKKKFLGAFLAMGVVTTAMMFFIGEGDWLLACALFVLANIAVNGSFVFYDAMLPHVAREDEMDRVSSAGYALGYIGGGLLLAINFVWVLKPHWFGMADAGVAARVSFVSVAVWWLVFSIPLFRKVAEPAVVLTLPARPGGRAGQASLGELLSAALKQLGQSFRDLRGYRNAFIMLLAFLIYNDGIGTIIRMAAVYGEEIKISADTMMAAIMITQFVGIPFAFLFGMLAGRIGVKTSIFLGLVAYMVISVIGYFMKTDAHFLLLAILVGMVQGGTQALSRSLFASMIPRYQSGQFFGFFAVVEKFAGILGPATFAIVKLMGGTSRMAILSVIAYFVVGGALLCFVRVAEGQHAAREAEARAAKPA